MKLENNKTEYEFSVNDPLVRSPAREIKIRDMKAGEEVFIGYPIDAYMSGGDHNDDYSYDVVYVCVYNERPTHVIIPPEMNHDELQHAVLFNRCRTIENLGVDLEYTVEAKYYLTRTQHGFYLTSP